MQCGMICAIGQQDRTKYGVSFLFLRKHPPLPQIQSSSLVESAGELFAFELFNEDFTREELCSRHQMPAEDFSLSVAEGYVRMHEWFSISHANVAGETHDFHPISELPENYISSCSGRSRRQSRASSRR